MSGTTLEPSSNDHPETEEEIEEGRDSTIEPSPPYEQFGSEDVFTEILNQSSSVEGVLNLEPDPFMKRLPHRHNRAIPNSVQEALVDPRWKTTMNKEMKSLQKNKTWELVECPPRKKPVGCRWIYTVKYKADDQHGSRLLSLAANLDWPLQQFDMKNAFLHGELSEVVYMDLTPRCMVSEKQCQKVCKLKKPLYGLKQSSRAWFGRFIKSMRAFGYRQSGNLVTWKVRSRMSSLVQVQKRNLGATNPIVCDNKVVCDIAHNPVQHDRTKHVEVEKFSIKEKLDDKIVKLPKIRSEDQLANILTKAAVYSRLQIGSQTLTDTPQLGPSVSSFSVAKVPKWNEAMIVDLKALESNGAWTLTTLLADVNNVFLHGDLQEEVYMELSPGYSCEGEISLPENIITLTKVEGQSFIALLLYVDDIIMGSNSLEQMTRSSKGISICQRQYALQLLLEIGHLRCKTRKTPRDVNVKLAQDDGELLDDPL
ncbi:Retrovirus-related Pol polyprotein from transposon RE1 [Vitis vinifera]|uniref:Retrovirus-related Pol polyprotein from transposon RE1 n=1 Tax=Vitis vinifera TaxID=29760 RepID=A0A438GMX9_VITVI|nr:Retrovirus-related Pol polyprotein from transposon RE1 [Vitis vinifera]